ncbi:hypothetical protein ACQCSX_08740 [Pseudarthrobacter sp. P1]
MSNHTARAMQGAVQFIFYTCIVLAFFFTPSTLVALTLGGVA